METLVFVNIYPDLNQMVIAQDMGCNHIYMATVVAVDPTPASVGDASPRGTVRRTQNIGCALVVFTFRANLHKCHLTAVGELHHRTKRQCGKNTKTINSKGEKAISLVIH